MKIFKRNNLQETVEVETEISPIAEAETTQWKTTEIETGTEEIMGTTTDTEAGIEETTEITTEIEVEIGEIVDTTAEVEAEVETDLIPEKEEEINQDLDQVKDTLTGITSVTTATEQVIQHIDASDWRTI